MNEITQWLCDLARTEAKRQLCLAMIAGGDSPERVGERLDLSLKAVDTIIRLDMMSRKDGGNK